MDNNFIEMECGCKFKLDEFNQPIFDKDFKKLKFECPIVWELLSIGDTIGCFQIESYLGKKITKQLKPESIDDLAGLIAIMRPSCLESKLEDGKSITDHYIARKNRLERPTPFHPALAPILNNTYGLLIFQEQSMRIGTDLAGMSGSIADKYLRKGIGTKKADVIAEAKDIFLDGCKKQNIIDTETAEKIFVWLENSARYQFNASHSYSYAYLTFITAYAKAHFPLRFFRSYLSHAKSKIKPLEEISKLGYNAREHNIFISTPDIRLKNKDFLIRNDRIYFGLGAIKEVGESVLDQVFEVLENVDFKDVGWTELLIKYLVRIKKTGVKRMIATGCFDFYKIPRKRMLYEHENYLNLSKKEQKWIIDNLDLNCSLSDIYKKMLDFEPTDKKNKAISNKNRYNIIKGAKHLLDNPGSPLVDRVEEISNYEKSFLGIAITAHKIDAFNRNRSIYNCSEFEIIRPFDKTSIVGEISDFKRHITKNGDEMCFVSINDEFARLENLVMFPEVWQKNEGYIDKGNIVNFIGHKKDESFIVQNCIPAELKN